MDGTPSTQLKEVSEVRLPAWLIVSVAVHAAALFFGGGMVLGYNNVSRHAAITVDIVYEPSQAPIIAPTLQREIEQVANRPDASPLTVTPAHPEVPTDILSRTQVASALQHRESVTETRSSPQTSAPQNFPFDTYLGPDDLEQRAEPINDVLLYYPRHAYAGRIRGVVQFQLYISDQGILDKAELVEATPRGLFEEAAWNAVKKLRFTPAIRHGRPVASRKRIDVVFDPNDPQPPPRQPESSVAER